MALIIRTDNTIAPVDEKHFVDKELPVHFLQKTVKGYFKLLALPKGLTIGNEIYYWMILNEEGKRHKLPKNYLATQYATKNIITKGEYVLGDVMLLKNAELGFEDTSQGEQYPE
ncbi:hypothetical protein PSI19_16270 [Xenorhabdus khoisanae]|uniref:hypothetical protein n=1 Tax=Xenorhabdus TaxID=626 RepID=UPI0023582ABB|nr:hypothetical protein [Xenorhabdus khoisanae]MDC9615393.1 hypothetical protein [Xenorhabdus khoisanae]